MSLTTQIAKDLMSAMKNKETEKLDALRAIKTAFLMAKTNAGAGGEISEDEELKIVQKLVKQRKDSANEFAAQNRQDLADKELQEAEIISMYLPKQMTAEEITVVVKAIIEQVGASSIKDMGKVMGLASTQLAGKADGKVISEIVKASLL